MDSSLSPSSSSGSSSRPCPEAMMERLKSQLEVAYAEEFLQVVLKEHLVLTLFRDEYDLLHEDYQLFLLPSILESKKLAKSRRAKQKYADLEYNVAKQVEKMIS
ncbi:probable protein NAP1 [Zingiber officinale]|uniref:probable protein NAP1 n=1 Tax=Zingiber officinale TaxID=94328 RepID=UPI001C4D87A7|nr:probable protein NAP1 [Zingiber officinale]